MEERDGWLIVDVVPKAVERAQAMRAERDQSTGTSMRSWTPTHGGSANSARFTSEGGYATAVSQTSNRSSKRRPESRTSS